MDNAMITGGMVLLLLLGFDIFGAVSGRLSLALTGFLGLIALLQGFHLVQLYHQRQILRFLVEEKKRKTASKAVMWEEEEQKKLEVVKKRVELNMLQSQINPHFLYNTLDCIRSRALLDGQTELAQMTEILSKFFRYCISRSERLVKIREELNHIQDYYYIQKYRFEDRFDMEVEVEDERICDYYIPKMTLQPLVENAMIHGLEKVSRRGELRLRVFMTERKVVLVVSDNGAGMDREQLRRMNERMEQPRIEGSRRGKHNSIAVANVNAQIRLTFGQEYGIHYHSLEDQGTDAIVRIPKIDDFSRNKYEDELGNNH